MQGFELQFSPMASEKQVQADIELGQTAQDYQAGETVASSGCNAQVVYVNEGIITAKVIPNENHCGSCVLVCNRRKNGGEPLFDNKVVVE